MLDQQKKTHREVKEPKMAARYLADYMNATEIAQRSIVQRCKYPAIARVIQHDEAKAIVGKFIRDGEADVAILHQAAQKLRDRLADSPFDRALYDHNADYIERFAKIFATLKLPEAELLVPGKTPALQIKGVRVTTEIHFRLQRLTKTNEVRIGAGMLRYAKGRALPPAIGEWQSAFLLGYLHSTNINNAEQPEGKLCITLDAQTGKVHCAPTNSVTRLKNMKAACESIAERWPAIKPPKGAIL